MKSRGSAKLHLDDVALIRAWAAGPGQHLSVYKQAEQLAVGVNGWWHNWCGVKPPTILDVLRGQSFSLVPLDEARLARGRAAQDVTHPWRGLDRVGGRR